MQENEDQNTINEESSNNNEKTNNDSKTFGWKIVSGLLFIIVVVFVLLFVLNIDKFTSGDGILSSSNADGKTEKIVPGKPLDEEKAKKYATDFVNNYLIRQGEAKLKGITEAYGMYQVTFQYQGQEIKSFMSKDGKVFFPSSMDVADMKEKREAQKKKEEEAKKPTPKKAKPEVEVFIMTYCPYGTQIQKGIIPVMEKLKDKADIKIKFCDYAMHDKKEIDENLTQYCIQKDFNDKYIPYLKCFLKEGKPDACFKEAGIDKAKIDECSANIDKQFNITKDYEDKDKKNWKGRFPPFKVQAEENKKYEISGSPGFVVNGKNIRAGRDSNSLMKAICEGFENPPAECKEELESKPPKPGFGF